MRANNNRDVEFAYGAGEIDPFKAEKPGLVYDVGESDYKLYNALINPSLRFVHSIHGTREAAIVSGSLVWDDGEFQVRSPKFTVIVAWFMR
ncbi:hypothetical protein Fmac_031136 [Flemingia macrophylla]|uniref:Uncharacterized protein n=1 Tax=Flemingia macrophylla TaxID=520843 RepID=A0ABD1L168_9FABA